MEQGARALAIPRARFWLQEQSQLDHTDVPEVIWKALTEIIIIFFSSQQHLVLTVAAQIACIFFSTFYKVLFSSFPTENGKLPTDGNLIFFLKTEKEKKTLKSKVF